MEVYRTEQEQIEALKKYFAQYGSRTILAILAAIAIFFGYQAWKHSQQAARDTSSLYYNQLVEAVGSGESLSGENQKKFDDAYANLLKEYPKSIYASYAALHKAKIEVDKLEWDKAAQSLQWVVDAAVNKEMVALASLRLARVEFARGNIDQGLELLKRDPGPFVAEFSELSGDMQLEKNEPEKALLEYKKAQAFIAESGSYTNRLLEMKIESLSSGDNSKLYPAGLPEDKK